MGCLPSLQADIVYLDIAGAKAYLLSLAEGQPWQLAQQLLANVGATAAEAMAVLPTCPGQKPTAGELAASWQPRELLTEWWSTAKSLYSPPVELAAHLLHAGCLRALLAALPPDLFGPSRIADIAGKLFAKLCQCASDGRLAGVQPAQAEATARVLLEAGACPRLVLCELRSVRRQPVHTALRAAVVRCPEQSAAGTVQKAMQLWEAALEAAQLLDDSQATLLRLLPLYRRAVQRVGGRLDEQLLDGLFRIDDSAVAAAVLALLPQPTLQQWLRGLEGLSYTCPHMQCRQLLRLVEAGAVVEPAVLQCGWLAPIPLADKQTLRQD